LTSPAEAARELGEAMGEWRALADRPPRWNVAPTQLAPVLVNRPTPTVENLRWGLVPRWADDLAIGGKLINARGESAAEKPAFRDALARRRCLVPIDGFYEWRAEGKRRAPLWIRREPRRAFALAGLWERWRAPDGEPIHSFAILTTAATAALAAIHDRMPVILGPADWARWLHPEPLPPEALVDLLAPSDTPLAVVPVSEAVNSPRVDGPECLAPPAQASLF
jgi:putative SOS response-associated peptidase YedK